MKFSVPNAVRVTAKKNITSKAGNPMTFVTFANKETFEVLETKLALTDGQSEAVIVEGHDYNAVVEYDGTYGSVTLFPVPANTKTTAAGFPASK